MSLINNIKSRGPRLDHWGTPEGVKTFLEIGRHSHQIVYDHIHNSRMTELNHPSNLNWTIFSIITHEKPCRMLSQNQYIKCLLEFPDQKIFSIILVLRFNITIFNIRKWVTCMFNDKVYQKYVLKEQRGWVLNPSKWNRKTKQIQKGPNPIFNFSTPYLSNAWWSKNITFVVD